MAEGRPHVVKDLSLAPLGRKLIEAAEHEMPGLSNLPCEPCCRYLYRILIVIF